MLMNSFCITVRQEYFLGFYGLGERGYQKVKSLAQSHIGKKKKKPWKTKNQKQTSKKRKHWWKILKIDPRIFIIWASSVKNITHADRCSWEMIWRAKDCFCCMLFSAKSNIKHHLLRHKEWRIEAHTRASVLRNVKKNSGWVTAEWGRWLF